MLRCISPNVLEDDAKLRSNLGEHSEPHILLLSDEGQATFRSAESANSVYVFISSLVCQFWIAHLYPHYIRQIHTRMRT